ncbi:MAG: diphthamide biosynthesis enzyme Dph2 [Candidatus Caldarchaeum sp.]|nr:diphthamide biosynthesis enzyme Dph2 [Candidatus Caldarchaeum sp.]MCS7133907.1 diphthamide biosynthesis enzyme Dph2 [Candidatus Caldarchaeum sp.]MDW8062815.1 diphthamide biosynthesis enzyme Dph2 [Candidatus Caldarchaeum sp.]MDW8435820.1 diphthamide biosynthesis enzyme Dph2 [Candidatus Caldarchaeum sp.]
MPIINNYDVKLENVLEALRERNASKILVQSPLGLRSVALKVGEILREEGFEVVFSSSNCWGGCDVAYTEANNANVDYILHLGHSRFLKRDKFPTAYIECRYANPAPVKSLIDKVVDAITGLKRVGVGASVQWLDFIPEVAELLKSRGVEPVTAEPDLFSVYNAQVLGCDVSALKKIEDYVDGFLVLGSVFHGLGVAVSTRKTVVAADPHSQQVKNLEQHREKILRQRFMQITAFKQSEKVGVLVSVKPGQMRLGIAKRLNKALNESGKKSFIVTADEITVSTIMENSFDGFVNTACPRLSLEDQATFGKPVLLPVEALVSVGYVDWVDVVEGGYLMYPWGWSSREIGEKIWRKLVQIPL